MTDAVQEPEGGIDNTLASAFAQIRAQVAESEAKAAGDGDQAEEAPQVVEATPEPKTAKARAPRAVKADPAAETEPQAEVEAEAPAAAEAAPDAAPEAAAAEAEAVEAEPPAETQAEVPAEPETETPAE
jgi:hypothetical protein